jgi:hypothetical protein
VKMKSNSVTLLTVPVSSVWRQYRCRLHISVKQHELVFIPHPLVRNTILGQAVPIPTGGKLHAARRKVTEQLVRSVDDESLAPSLEAAVPFGSLSFQGNLG